MHLQPCFFVVHLYIMNCIGLYNTPELLRIGILQAIRDEKDYRSIDLITDGKSLGEIERVVRAENVSCIICTTKQLIGSNLPTKLSTRFKIPILLLSSNFSINQVPLLVEIGIKGCIPIETASLKTALDAVETVVKKRRYYFDGNPMTVEEIHMFLDELSAHNKELFGLTPKQGEVLTLIARGLSNREISIHCKISVQTVKNHITAIFHKLGVRSRTELAVVSIVSGFVPITPEWMEQRDDSIKVLSDLMTNIWSVQGKDDTNDDN